MATPYYMGGLLDEDPRSYFTGAAPIATSSFRAHPRGMLMSHPGTAPRFADTLTPERRAEIRAMIAPKVDTFEELSIPIDTAPSTAITDEEFERIKEREAAWAAIRADPSGVAIKPTPSTGISTPADVREAYKKGEFRETMPVIIPEERELHFGPGVFAPGRPKYEDASLYDALKYSLELASAGEVTDAERAEAARLGDAATPKYYTPFAEDVAPPKPYGRVSYTEYFDKLHPGRREKMSEVVYPHGDESISAALSAAKGGSIQTFEPALGRYGDPDYTPLKYEYELYDSYGRPAVIGPKGELVPKGLAPLMYDYYEKRYDRREDKAEAARDAEIAAYWDKIDSYTDTVKDYMTSRGLTAEEYAERSGAATPLKASYAESHPDYLAAARDAELVRAAVPTVDERLDVGTVGPPEPRGGVAPFSPDALGYKIPFIGPAKLEHDKAVAEGRKPPHTSAYGDYELDRALEKAGVTMEEFREALFATGHTMSPEEFAGDHLYKGLAYTPLAALPPIEVPRIDIDVPFTEHSIPITDPTTVPVGSSIAGVVKDALESLRSGVYAVKGRDADSALIDKVKSYLEPPKTGISALGPKDPSLSELLTSLHPGIIDPTFAPDASIHYSDPLKHYDTEAVPGHVPLSLTTPVVTALEGMEEAYLDAATRAKIDADMASGMFTEVAGRGWKGGPTAGKVYDARDFITDFGPLTASTHGEDPWRGLTTADFATDAEFRPGSTAARASGLARFGLGAGSLGAGLATYSEPLGIGSDIPGRIPAAHHGPVWPLTTEIPIDATGAPISVDDFSSLLYAPSRGEVP